MLNKYKELGIAPEGISSDQRAGFPNPPHWFSHEWERINRRVTNERLALLVKYWEEEALRHEGRHYKAKADVATTLRREVETRDLPCLMKALERVEDDLAPRFEEQDRWQAKETRTFLNKLERVRKERGEEGGKDATTSSRPGLSLVAAAEGGEKMDTTNAPSKKPSTYAEMVARKGKQPAPKEKQQSSTTTTRHYSNSSRGTAAGSSGHSSNKDRPKSSRRLEDDAAAAAAVTTAAAPTHPPVTGEDASVGYVVPGVAVKIPDFDSQHLCTMCTPP